MVLPVTTALYILHWLSHLLLLSKYCRNLSLKLPFWPKVIQKILPCLLSDSPLVNSFLKTGLLLTQAMLVMNSLKMLNFPKK